MFTAYLTAANEDTRRVIDCETAEEAAEVLTDWEARTIANYGHVLAADGRLVNATA